MNAVEAVVTKINGKPEIKYGKYFVKCTVNAYGRESETAGMFNTREEAESFKVGDKLDV